MDDKMKRKSQALHFSNICCQKCFECIIRTFHVFQNHFIYFIWKCTCEIFFFWASLSPATKGLCSKPKIAQAMNVLCYFPLNLRLQSAARLLSPILPEDIIHPVSWLKSGISARLDLLDLSTYAFPFKRVILCLELYLSFLFLFLHSFGTWNIPQDLWEYLKQIHAINSMYIIILTVNRLKYFLFTYLSISYCRVQTNRFFLSYLYTSWQSPVTLSALNAVNQTNHRFFLH